MEFQSLGFAVLTVSDTRGADEDKSGDLLVERLTSAGHKLAARDWIKDERVDITRKLEELCHLDTVQVVLSTGGTGLTGRDVSVEAHRALYEKEIEAFATLFTLVSYKSIGTPAILSRATGGVYNGKYLFALPGSTGACRDAWDEILSLQFDTTKSACNFIEIMPRLNEHKA